VLLVPNNKRADFLVSWCNRIEVAMREEMKLAIVFIILGWCWSGCGHAEVAPPIQPFFTQFKIEAESENVTVFIGNIAADFGDVAKYASVPGEVVFAVCVRGWDIQSKLVVNKELWDLADKNYREAIIFHELGHCALEREHEERQRDDAKGPLSLMFHAPDPEAYAAMRRYYIHELFHPY
jgi:hypothetical protein